MLQNLYNINHRIYYHAFFWTCYYVLRVMIYGDVKNTYENVAYVQALELIMKMAVTYFSIYYLKPHLFDKGKYFWFALTFVITLLIATYLQLHIIILCIKLGIYAPLPHDYIFSVKKFISANGHIAWIVSIAFGIKVMKDAHMATRKTAQLAKEKLETELQFLKSQINPHFFFNTLNNLYSLIIKKSEAAGDVVLKLSDLMSYMIYEAGNDAVLLKKEIEYLKNYIELEQLRYKNINIDFNIHGQVEQQKIAPLVLLPFVENAFKHGISKASNDNFLNLNMTVSIDELKLNVSNSIKKKDKVETSDFHGIGLQNVKRRLQLLYPNEYQLTEELLGDQYQVNLKLNFSGNIKLQMDQY